MPAHNITIINLPAEQPDCCATCPLLGLVPKNLRPHGSKETHVCLGTMEALSGRGTRVRASEKDIRHKWHRHCDDRWLTWMQLPNRRLGINTQSYLQCRVPYEQGLQMQIKFHKSSSSTPE